MKKYRALCVCFSKRFSWISILESSDLKDPEKLKEIVVTDAKDKIPLLNLCPKDVDMVHLCPEETITSIIQFDRTQMDTIIGATEHG